MWKWPSGLIHHHGNRHIIYRCACSLVTACVLCACVMDMCKHPFILLAHCHMSCLAQWHECVNAEKFIKIEKIRLHKNLFDCSQVSVLTICLKHTPLWPPKSIGRWNNNGEYRLNICIHFNMYKRLFFFLAHVFVSYSHTEMSDAFHSARKLKRKGGYVEKQLSLNSMWGNYSVVHCINFLCIKLTKAGKTTSIAKGVNMCVWAYVHLYIYEIWIVTCRLYQSNPSRSRAADHHPLLQPATGCGTFSLPPFSDGFEVA